MVWTVLAGEALYLAILLTVSPEPWFRASGPVLMSLVASAGGCLLSRGKTFAALTSISSLGLVLAQSMGSVAVQEVVWKRIP